MILRRGTDHHVSTFQRVTLTLIAFAACVVIGAALLRWVAVLLWFRWTQHP